MLAAVDDETLLVVAAAASQKTQPGCSSACLMYSSRHGAHSCLVMAPSLSAGRGARKFLHVKRFLLLIVLAAVASGAAAPSAQRMKVVPAGVQIGGVRVGGLTSEQARNAISWWYNRPLRFVFYGKQWTVRPTTLGASVDTDWAVQRVLRARPNEHVGLRVDTEADTLKRYVRALDGQLSVEPVDATASLEGRQPVIEPGKTGLELNRVKTAQRIEALLAIARRPQSVHRLRAPSRPR